MGFMTGEIVKAPGHRQAVYHLRLKDIWPHNMAWSIEHLSIDARLEHATSLSVQGVNRSGGELDRSGGEPKKNKKKTKRRPYARATGALLRRLASSPSRERFASSSLEAKCGLLPGLRGRFALAQWHGWPGTILT